MTSARPTAVITGASSGIGAATALHLAAKGFDLVLGARRLDRLAEVSAQITGGAGSTGDASGEASATAFALDVTQTDSVGAFAAQVPACDVLVCAAGGALGVERVDAWDESHWEWMYQANVLGVVRTVNAFLPQLRASRDARIVIVTSVAGHHVYPNGAGYTTAKHGAAVVADTLRLELIAEPIRIIEIAPGLVNTEFSAVRFGGDQARADAVYQGIKPLVADDVADAIAWAVTRPAHVTPSRIDLMPRNQAGPRDVHRQA